MDVLDNPVWWSLVDRQRELGAVTSSAARFDPEVAPFGGFSADPAPSDWADLADLSNAGGMTALMGIEGEAMTPPPGWEVLREIPAVQMIGPALGGRVGGRAPATPSGPGPADVPVPLTAVDTDDMLELVGLAQPGPFLRRTVEFGGYLGIRRAGCLVAMAGERLRPTGYAEISAVTTHPDHRRQGLAELLVRAVATSIAERGETPFLHASVGNSDAIRLYEAMGFTVRRTLSIAVVRSPVRSSP
ncbi:MAG: GNAT family N-acetyltransferase [Acidimicrobiales bacterium]